MKVAKVISRYLSVHPFERDCLARGLINYSKLSRQICSELGIKNFDAVLVACRRYASKLTPKEDVDVLKRSKINVKMEKGIAFVSVKLSKPVKGALSYLSTLFLENDIEILSSRSAKNSLLFEIKSNKIDSAMRVLKS